MIGGDAALSVSIGFSSDPNAGATSLPRAASVRRLVRSAADAPAGAADSAAHASAASVNPPVNIALTAGRLDTRWAPSAGHWSLKRQATSHRGAPKGEGSTR